MKAALRLLGILLMLLGAIWFLQGINILPGSFMTGQIQWAINGGATFATGLIAFLAARKVGGGKDRK
ncbi:hypothetical protein [Undibacterium sp.]|jgi:hypothetical protein|uniref:hypothetical protein n=1 Tax=Undibacterium sp. TaxID=1914977 RepID=UPI002CC31BAC|nr:hypothetical protein [Undibacterium sp.]HTD03600.1 hypothetical protein [Undibacterium sp.]